MIDVLETLDVIPRLCRSEHGPSTWELYFACKRQEKRAVKTREKSFLRHHT